MSAVHLLRNVQRIYISPLKYTVSTFERIKTTRQRQGKRTRDLDITLISLVIKCDPSFKWTLYDFKCDILLLKNDVSRRVGTSHIYIFYRKAVFFQLQNLDKSYRIAKVMNVDVDTLFSSINIYVRSH